MNEELLVNLERQFDSIADVLLEVSDTNGTSERDAGTGPLSPEIYSSASHFITKVSRKY